MSLNILNGTTSDICLEQRIDVVIKPVYSNGSDFLPGQVQFKESSSRESKYMILVCLPNHEEKTGKILQVLYTCYQKAMLLANENGCERLAMPILFADEPSVDMFILWQIAIHGICETMDDLDSTIQVYLMIDANASQRLQNMEPDDLSVIESQRATCKQLNNPRGSLGLYYKDVNFEDMTDEEIDEFFRPQKQNSRKSLAPLFVYQILKAYSSPDIHLSQAEILDYLADIYELEIERKALSRILHNLEAEGTGIFGERGKGFFYDADCERDIRRRVEVD